MSSQASILVRKAETDGGRNGMKDSPENNQKIMIIIIYGDDGDEKNNSNLHEDLCSPLRFMFKGS